MGATPSVIVGMLLLLLTFVVTSLPPTGGVTLAQAQTMPSPREATVCDLLKEPTAWNHVLVRVTAVATHAFESFTLSSSTCEDSRGLWLTFGGRAQSGAIYCCPGEGDESAPSQPLVVEDVELPLVEDPTFHRFRALLRKEPRGVARAARVTLVGTFFAGHPTELAVTPTGLGGFGHLGCCSLLVIQRVEQFQSGSRQR